MDHVAILKLINEAESRFPVEEWKSGDVRIWPLLRLKLAFLLYAENNPAVKKTTGSVNQPKENGLSEKIKKKINWKNRSLKHRLDNFRVEKKVSQKGTIAFFSLVANRTLLENVWHNRSVDPILDELKKEHVPLVLFEYKGTESYKYPRYNDALCIDFDDIFNANSGSRPAKNSELILPEYDVFLSFLKESHPSLEVNHMRKEAIQALIKYFEVAVDYFYDLIRKSGIRICFTTCYYEMKMMALISACKKAGVRTIELPHGTHGDTHAAFGKWQKVPEGGYQMLPDIFWCWSDNERRAIEEWALPQKAPHKAVVGGNPWLLLWKDDTHPMVKKFDASLERVITSKALKVLFTVQPFNDEREAMPEAFVEAIRRSPSNWQWLIRLHPRQPQSIEYFEETLRKVIDPSRFNVREATAFPLPALLRHTDVHATLFSSTVVEAAEFGISSIVFRNGADIFKSLVSPERVLCVENDPLSILDGIEQQIKKKSEMKQSAVNSYAILKKIISEN